MPTILTIFGWRLFFYANERDEPIHIHCRKAGAECKFWLDKENYDIIEAYSYGLTVAQRREIRKIIFDHFGYIEYQWEVFQRERR